MSGKNFIELMAMISTVAAYTAKNGGVTEGQIASAAATLIAAGARDKAAGVRISSEVSAAIGRAKDMVVDSVSGVEFGFAPGLLVVGMAAKPGGPEDATPVAIDGDSINKIASSTAVIRGLGGDGLLSSLMGVKSGIGLHVGAETIDDVKHMLQHHLPKEMSDAELSAMIGMTLGALSISSDRARIILSLALAGMKMSDDIDESKTATKH